jgi:serine/threonine protein kinase
VYESERTRVTRVSCAEGSGIRKEPLGPDAEHRLRHEVAILERLRGVEGVAQLAQAPRYPGSIVLVDVGGRSLAGLAKPLAVDDSIGLAVQLAEAVARMHRRGVMHRDITPANIVISCEGALRTAFARRMRCSSAPRGQPLAVRRSAAKARGAAAQPRGGAVILRWSVTALPSRHLTQDSCVLPQQNGAIGNRFDEEGP